MRILSLCDFPKKSADIDFIIVLKKGVMLLLLIASQTVYIGFIGDEKYYAYETRTSKYLKTGNVEDCFIVQRRRIWMK